MEKNVWKRVLSGTVALVMVAGGINCVDQINARTPMLRAAAVESTKSQEHKIEISKVNGGTIKTVSYGSKKELSKREAGKWVDVQVYPDDGYYLSFLVSQGVNQWYDDDEFSLGFTMPDSDIKLTPVFAEIPEGADKKPEDGMYAEYPVFKDGRRTSDRIYIPVKFQQAEDGQDKFAVVTSAGLVLDEGIDYSLTETTENTSEGIKHILTYKGLGGPAIDDEGYVEYLGVPVHGEKTIYYTEKDKAQETSYGLKFDAVNGKVTFTDANGANINKARKGDRVYFTLEPDKNYWSSRTVVTAEDTGDNIEVNEESNGAYSFEMPASGVVVKQTFVKKNVLEVGELKNGFLNVVYEFTPETDGVYEFQVGISTRSRIFVLCDDDNGNLWEENTVKTELGNKCELEGGRVYNCMITAEGFNHDKTNIKVLKLDDRAMENKYELGSATANGTVTFTDENGNVIKEGYAGDRVYFSIKANEGYDANCFDVVNLGTLDEIEYRKEGKGVYSFEMPDAEIFVDVVYLRNGDYDLPKLDEGVTLNCKFGETYRFTPETDGVYEFRAGDKEKTDLKITLYGWDVETNKSEYGNYCTLKAGEMYKVSMTVNGADNDSMVPPFFIEKVASHEITIANVKHGKIEVTFAEGADGKVDFNTPVSVKFIPDKGYKLKNAYLDCYDSVTKIKPDKNGVYEFSMPNSDVELGAVFQKTNKK